MGAWRASTGDLANSIGVDVMRIHIPANETFPTFLESLEATVGLFITTDVPNYLFTYPADTGRTSLPLRLIIRQRHRSYCPL